MQEATNAHEPPWDELARIQELVGGREPKDPAARRAMDDAYSTIVDEVRDHTPESLRRRFESLILNRRRKQRDRQAIDNFLARDADPLCGIGDPAELLEQRETVAVLLAAIPREDGALLWGVATGSSYRDLAAAGNQPVGTLKSRASRLRNWLRTEFRELSPAA